MERYVSSIQRHQVLPQTVQELTDALIQVWDQIPKDTIHRLIRSIHRCRECIEAGEAIQTTELHELPWWNERNLDQPVIVE